jgi:predicted nuclease of predicted toxin-antitoxin system
MVAFKLDENLGKRTGSLLSVVSEDVSSVLAQGLSGVSDDRLIDVCREEHRCLVTLDLDFGNAVHYPPMQYSGIVVLGFASGYKRSV